MTRLVTDRAPGAHGARTRGEVIDVRRRDDVPEQFLWRGRLYLVREVLARWTEAGGWWRADPATAVPGALEDGEQEWWRVEAASGRLAALSAGPGVYDLCFTWSTGVWTLTRVQD